MPKRLTKKEYRKQEKEFMKQKILFRDKEIYKSFYNVGYLKKEDIKQLGMSENKFYQLERFKLVEKHEVLNRNSKEYETYYKLTDKGKNFVADKMNYKRDYYSSRSKEHDIFVSKNYMRLKEEFNFKADNWRNESECRELQRDRMNELREQDNQRYEELRTRDISPADGMLVLDNGQSVCIEITTDRYGQAEIQAKQEFANLVNSQISFMKAY